MGRSSHMSYGQENTMHCNKMPEQQRGKISCNMGYVTWDMSRDEREHSELPLILELYSVTIQWIEIPSPKKLEKA